LALLIAAALLAPAAAGAAEGDPSDPNPYRLGIQQEFSADTNLFRSPSGSERSRDVISSTSLVAGIDQPFGRQRFSADLSGTANRYKNNDQLDGTTHSLSARLDWATAGRLSGDAKIYERSNLFRYDLDRQQTFTGRTVQRSRGGSLQARLGVVTEWTLEGGLSTNNDRYSRLEFQYRDLRQTAANLGLRWAPTDLFSARLGVRRTDGRFPHYSVDDAGAPLADDFTRDDIELSVRWTPTANSDLRARVARTREEHELQGSRDGTGWTGELIYDWRLTGKTALSFNAGRDSSAGASSFSDEVIVNDSSDARKTTRLGAQLRYQATSKIQALLDVGHVRRTLDDTFVLTPVQGGTPLANGVVARDRLTTVNLRLRYQATEGLSFGCSVGRERRSTSDEELTYPYDATTAACFGLYMWR
jgi:hypothetical protein